MHPYTFSRKISSVFSRTHKQCPLLALCQTYCQTEAPTVLCSSPHLLCPKSLSTLFTLPLTKPPGLPFPNSSSLQMLFFKSGRAQNEAGTDPWGNKKQKGKCTVFFLELNFFHLNNWTSFWEYILPNFFVIKKPFFHEIMTTKNLVLYPWCPFLKK